MVSAHGTLIEGANGGLQVWHPPIEKRLYVIGADTSAGVRDGDYSCAQVLDSETSEQVAEYHGLYRPTQWGYICARLAAYYGNAWLAFETHPSQHGLTAYEAASRYGCTSLWVQRKYDQLEGRVITRKGWVRTPHSTMFLLNRGRDALAEGCIIHSEGLVDEMQSLRTEEGKIKSSTNDDRVLAYCIALMIRDDAWHRGEVKRPEEVPTDPGDLYWKREAEADTPSEALADDRYDWSAL